MVRSWLKMRMVDLWSIVLRPGAREKRTRMDLE